ncbi:Uncharacterised protein [Segatella copri]|nr:Uncharacterised protein [Segatella copri]
MGVCSRSRLLLVHSLHLRQKIRRVFLPYCRSWRNIHIGALPQVIMVDAQTYRQIVLMSKIGLKNQ